MMKTLPQVTLETLQRALPPSPLFGDGEAIGWKLSPEPFALTPAQTREIGQIGDDLAQLALAVNQLYWMASKQPDLLWVKALLDQGKPQSLISFSQMNRFKNAVPLVIRPDLLVTENGFALCEIDAVPGGLGFTGALFEAYRAVGFECLGESMPHAFLRLIKSATPLPNPTIAVIVSDEAGDYRKEWAWLVETLQTEYPSIYLCHPKTMTLMGDTLGFVDTEGHFQPIDVVYRFFELFDLPNIPQIELIQYAVKKGLVACTPPFKPYLEEKLVLGLIHMPRLAPVWHALLGENVLARLQKLIPQTWLLDPTPVPYFAQVTPSMILDGKVVHDFEALKSLTQKQRRLVIKPSGFSPLAWGSRGVVVGHDTPQAQWQEALDSALSQFETTPHVLQVFHTPAKHPYRYFEGNTQNIVEAQGRTRLCPYFFVEPDGVHWVGTLATTCPVDKKVIHGMKDGVLRPVMATL